MALIAVDGDVCASMAVYWPVAMRAGDEVVPGAQGMEAVTHPDYRNRPRLFRRLAEQGAGTSRSSACTAVHVSERALDQAHEARRGHVSRRGRRLGNRPRAAPGLRLPRLSRRQRRACTRRRSPSWRSSLRSSRQRSATSRSCGSTRAGVARRGATRTRRARTTSGSSSGRVGSLTAAALLGERDTGAWGAGLRGHLPHPRAVRTRRAGGAVGARRSVERVFAAPVPGSSTCS